MKRSRMLRRLLMAATGLGVAAVVAGYAILSHLRVDDLRVVLEKQARDLTGRDLTIGGPITLQPSLFPVISVTGVTYANADWGTWPEMVSLEQLELEVALLPLLSGELQVRRLVLVRPTILLETDAEGRGNWVLAGGEHGAAAEPSADSGLSIAPWFNEIALRDGRAIFRDGRSGHETHLTLNTLTLETDHREAPIAVALAGGYNGTPVEGTGRIGTYGDVIGGQSIPISLRLATGGSVVRFDGALREPRQGSGLDLQISARGASLADLSGLTDLDLPSFGPYTLAAHLKEDAPRIRITGLALRVGESDLSGNLTLDVGSDPVSITGTLSSQQIRLQDFSGSREPESADGDRLFSALPLPFDGLEDADLALSVTADALHLSAEAIVREIGLELVLKDSRLTLPTVRAAFEGARILGNATLETVSDPPRLALDLRALGVDYGRLLTTLAAVEGVTGSVDLELKGSGQGNTLQALAATWDGRLDIVGGEGRVREDLLSGSGVGLIDLIAGWREADSDLRLTCVVGRWPIVQGRAKADVVLIDTATVTVAASGTVDLRDETLDLRISPRSKGTSLMSLAVPVRLSGPLADPTVGPDPLGTAVGAARIAGMVINPLATGAAILLDAEVFTDRNPCVAALRGEAAGGGPGAPSNPAIDRAAEGLGGTVTPGKQDAKVTPTERGGGPQPQHDRR